MGRIRFANEAGDLGQDWVRLGAENPPRVHPERRGSAPEARVARAFRVSGHLSN